MRWGGLAGLLGAALLLFVFVFVGAVVGADPAGPEGPVARFPEIRAARTLENSLYLIVMALWTIHFVALSRALRGVSLAPALSGGVLGIVGLALLAAGALPHVATSRLSDLYHAPAATLQDQATVVLLWQANQASSMRCWPPGSSFCRSASLPSEWRCSRRRPLAGDSAERRSPWG